MWWLPVCQRVCLISADVIEHIYDIGQFLKDSELQMYAAIVHE
jgi:hypothetical protein